MKHLGIAIVVGLVLALLAAFVGWTLYRHAPEGMAFIPNPCARPAHSFSLGYAIGLCVGAILSLLYSLACFLARLFRRSPTAERNLRRKAVIALLVPPLLLLFWPVHRVAETQLPIQPLPGCPPYAP